MLIGFLLSGFLAVPNPPLVQTLTPAPDRNRPPAGRAGIAVAESEGVGFEPTVGLTPRSISSRVP